MRSDIKGREILKADVVAHRVKLLEVAHALGDTSTADASASVGLFFGPTVVGYRQFVDAVDLDLTRALLGGHEIAWTRPFEPDEPVVAAMTMTEHSERNGMEIAVFETRFTTPDGEPIQTQRTTFIERAPKA